jgi:hypothetical protein
MSDQNTAPAPLALTWQEALQASRLGDTKLREAVTAGELAVIRVGDRVLVEPVELARWLGSKRVRGGKPAQEPDIVTASTGDKKAPEVIPMAGPTLADRAARRGCAVRARSTSNRSQ